MFIISSYKSAIAKKFCIILLFSFMFFPKVTLSEPKEPSPYAVEMKQIKLNMKLFPKVKKIAVLGVIEIQEDPKAGKTEYIYQRIASQKLAIRFDYLIPLGFKLISRSSNDVANILAQQKTEAISDLLDISKIPALSTAFGGDAILVAHYFTQSKNTFEIELQSDVIIKLIDSQSGALIWSKEVSSKEFSIPSTYKKNMASPPLLPSN